MKWFVGITILSEFTEREEEKINEVILSFLQVSEFSLVCPIYGA